MFRTAAPPALTLLVSLPLAAPLAAFDFGVTRFDDPAPDGEQPSGPAERAGSYRYLIMPVRLPG